MRSVVWKRMPRETGEHHFFVDGWRRIAIADSSIRKMSDPASTDDGLLLLDCSQPVQVDMDWVTIPIKREDGTPMFGVVIEPVKSILTLQPLFQTYGIHMEFSPFVRGFAKMVYAEMRENGEVQ